VKVDLIGNRFGRLLVLEETATRKGWKRYFLCECDCGTIREFAMAGLRKGTTKSCGCLRLELFIERRTQHGMCETPEYNSWRAMKERCNNPKNNHYHLYGERGITYDPKWETFEGFFEDMGLRPEGTTLDRIDSNGNYTKENCKWSNITEQNINTRVRKDNKLGVKGIKKEYNRFVVMFRGISIGRFSTIEEAINFRNLYETGELELNDEQLEMVEKHIQKKRDWKNKRTACALP